MIRVALEPEKGDSTVFNRAVNKLQSDISIGSNYISGKLKYNEKYTEFSSNPEQQSGHYLAIKANMTEHLDDVEDEESELGDTYDMGFELVNGKSGPTLFDQDKNAVIKISDPKTQKLRLFTKKKESPLSGPYTSVAEYRLSDLELEEKPKEE